ncbi:hypothetical protein WJX73_006192 [Symbiochloris irregularis]|uniref:DDHD domain-containing protein n=1 Tax=Symbiochloris irregularis TaxID=706552 RepID=A0AAW1NYZ4_9CHLO
MHTTVPSVQGEWLYAPLREDQIRWFWLTVPFSLKNIYQLDIPHRAEVLRFCNADNASLERSYRAQTTAVERAWWEEQAQFATGPTGKEQGGDKLAEDEEASLTWQDHVLGDKAEEGVGVLVRSGHFEVDLKRRRMKPCYWPASQHRVLRGSWFLQKGTDWVPLKETVADELEEAYRSGVWLPERGRLSNFHGLQGARVNLLTLVNEMKGMFALFVDAETVYLTKDDSAFTWLSRKFMDVTDIGPRLCRGYPNLSSDGSSPVSSQINAKAEEADDAAAVQPIGRLLYVVHGIGQNLSGSNIAGDAAAVRNNLYDLAVEQLPEEARDGMRTEVLPVQWRKHLALDVDVIAEAIMPPGVRQLRSMLHATAVEVLLSLTPLHAQDMLDSLISFINVQHSKFLARHPDFKGNVSIMAHSLGSVLMWDILCNQPHLQAHLHELAPSIRPAPPQPQEAGASMPVSPHSSISPDLVDLSPITSPSARSPLNSHPATPFGSPPKASRPSSMQDLNKPPEQAASAGTAGAAGSTPGSSDDRQERVWSAPEQRSAGATGTTQAQQLALSTPVDVKPLDFAVDQLIIVGSPLALFLALRRVNPAQGRGLGTPAAAALMQGASARAGDGLPAVRRVYNLYHPFDPVGYRMEPLIKAGAEKRRPVYASLASGGRRLHVGLTELSEDVSAATHWVGKTFKDKIMRSSSKPPINAQSKAEGNSPGTPPTPQEEEDAAAEDAAFRRSASADLSTSQSAVWRLTDGRGSQTGPSRLAAGRMDFLLQCGNVENPWLSAMSSHFAYWASPDVGLFVLRALHGLDVRTGSPLLEGLGEGLTSPRGGTPLTSPKSSAEAATAAGSKNLL